MPHKMDCQVATAKTLDEAERIAKYLNNQGIPTRITDDKLFGYTINTDKEHELKAQMIYLIRLHR